MLLTPRKKLLVVLSFISLLPILALVWTSLNFATLSTYSSSLSPSSPSPEPTTTTETMSVKQTVDQKISAGHVVVFSKSYCPYCRNAKNLLQSLGVDAEIYELDNMDEGSDWQNYLAEKTGQRTVPNIFIDGQHVGGSSDLEAKHKNGELKKLLGGKL
ncbi:glutaredoxin [Sporobolomyces salmoneus]|uniref:glutaredoxin n=1 Tax=Sporobolomyces salmoneus TaxID=183962 RepID=UPI00317E8636